MTKRWASVVVVVAVFTLAGGEQASADIISVFDNTSSTDTTYLTAVDSGTWGAQKFTAAGIDSVTSASLYMRRTSGNTGLLLEIWSDNSGVPGSSLGTLTSPTVGTGAGLYEFGTPSSDDVSVTVGATYWAVLKGQNLGTYDWYLASCSTGTGGGFSTDWAYSGAGSWFDGNSLYAHPLVMDLKGNEPPAAIPEPATFVLFGGALIAAIGCVRRKTRRIKAAV